MKLRNPILQTFYLDCYDWYEGGRKEVCYHARQRAYHRLILRRSADAIRRNTSRIASALDVAENSARKTWKLKEL